MRNKHSISVYSRSSSRITVVLLAFVISGDVRSDAAEELTNSIGLQLARIPAGELMMGSAEELSDAQEDERPRHRVRITAPFYIGRYEVTQAEFEKVMGPDHQFFFTPGGPGENSVRGVDTSRFPAEQVTWWDAIQFCDKLSFHPKELAARRVYRLPTEAEWEYACRAGTQTAVHFGDSLGADQANFNGRYLSATRYLVRFGAEPWRWGRFPRTGSACMTCTATCGNGARIGTAVTITAPPSSRIRKGPAKARAG